MKKSSLLSRIADAIAASHLCNAVVGQSWIAGRSSFIKQCISNPGGYYALERIYTNLPLGNNLFRRLADRLYLNAPMAKAARRRLTSAVRWTQAKVEQRLKQKDELRILDMPCGGARVLIESFRGQRWRNQVLALGIDLDPQAIRFAGHAAQAAGLTNVRFREANALNPELDDEPPFDFVLTLGLLDYLSDVSARRLVNRVYDLLAPGGHFLFGMTSKNPSRRFFEQKLGWSLEYRAPEAIDSFAITTQFRKSHIVADCDGCFLLVECRKE